MTTLWYALFRGKLCRIRKGNGERLISEVWRNGSWATGPDFAEIDFKGRMLLEDEAHEWMRNRFREKNLKTG